MGESMNELLEITESDIREVAEKLGGEYNQSEAGVGVAGTTNGVVYIGGMSDTYNAPAILAIERALLKKGVYSRFDLYGDVLVWSVLGTLDYDIVISDKQLNARNFRTWLTVQIVKALPKSVFESGQEGGGE